MEDRVSSFDDFSVDIGEFEVSKKGEFTNCAWECTEGGSIDQHPVIKDGKIFFGSLNRKFYALDMKTHEAAWIFEASDRIGLSSPALYKNSVIFGSYDRNIYRLDTKTGKLIWKFETQGEIVSSVMLNDNRCYFTCRDQNIYAINCDDGRLVWKFKTYKPNVSVPTIHNEMLLLGSADRFVYCLEKKTGSLLWKFETDEEIVAIRPFLVVRGCIYVGTLGGMMYSIDISNGRLIWKQKLGEYGMSRGGCYLKGKIIQPTQDGFLYAFTPEGKIVWKVVKNHAFTSVITDGERLYTSSEDEYFYCFDSNGKMVWRFRMKGPVWQPAKIHDGAIYFGSYDCNFYALSKEGKLLWKFKVPGSPSTYPPIKSFFEVTVKLSKDDIETEGEKTYELNFDKEDELNTSEYQSRITYQASTRYSSKGKYQIDSKSEEF